MEWFNRIGQRWSTEEETYLLQQLQDGKSVVDIAKLLMRLPKGVTMRIKSIEKDLKEKGISQDEIDRIIKSRERDTQPSDGGLHRFANTAPPRRLPH